MPTKYLSEKMAFSSTEPIEHTANRRPLRNLGATVYICCQMKAINFIIVLALCDNVL